LKFIRLVVPGALVIADAKRGDLGNTARFYADAFFSQYRCDGITVNPYMGIESLAPYEAFDDRAIFVLCLTSNPGSSQFQLRGTPPLYEQVALAVQERQTVKPVYWMVAGATQTGDSLKKIKTLAPDVPLLIPGIGEQG